MKSAEEIFNSLQKVSTTGHDCGSFYSPGRTYRVIDVKTIESILTNAYNSAIYDAASTTNSGMDNYQRIMGLLR